MGRQRNGKFRLRSTPRASCRVPRANPSGFASKMIKTWAAAGGRSLDSALAMRTPAHSLPWMHPTTRSRRALVGSPSSTARMGLPKTERPRINRRFTISGGDGGTGEATCGSSVASAADERSASSPCAEEERPAHRTPRASAAIRHSASSLTIRGVLTDAPYRRGRRAPARLSFSTHPPLSGPGPR